MNVREMEVADLEQVMPLEETLFSLPWSGTGFFSFLLREDALFLVAEKNGEILGYCGMLIAMDEGDVVKVGVVQEHQGQGIGRKLMEALIHESGKKGVSSIYLEVRISNRRAVRLYESLGFQQIGIRKNYYEHPREDGILMRRS